MWILGPDRRAEEGWLKIRFAPGGELAHERAGRKPATAAATEQTALIPPMLRIHGKTEVALFWTKQQWWWWEGRRLPIPDRRRRK